MPSLTILKRLSLLLLLSAPAQADTITGRVVDSNGVGVPNVNISPEDSNGGDGSIANGGTDSGGFFTATIDSGTYDIAFEPPPPPTTTLLTEVVVGQVVSGFVDMGTIVLPDGVSLGGRCVNGSSVGIENIDLDVVDTLTNQRLHIPRDKTDATGRFNIAVPASPIEVRFDTGPAFGGSYAPEKLNLWPTGNTNLGDIPFETGYTVVLVVHGPGFNPVEDADIDVFHSDTGEKRYTPGDNTDNNGLVDFVVPAGTFDIEICPPFSYGLVGTELLNRVITGPTNLGIVTLDPGVVLSGTVTSTSGIRLNQVDVDVRDSATGIAVVTCDDNTDSNGHYAVIVPPSTYDVTFTPPYGIKYGSRIYQNVAVGGATTRNGVLPDCDCGTAQGGGVAGTGGITPELAPSGGPLRLGNPYWTGEVTRGLGGSNGFLFVSPGIDCNGGSTSGAFSVLRRTGPPVAFSLSGANGAAGVGSASIVVPVPDDPTLLGLTMNGVAVVVDPAGPLGYSRTATLCGEYCW